jgi:hypothetical protein
VLFRAVKYDQVEDQVQLTVTAFDAYRLQA